MNTKCFFCKKSDTFKSRSIGNGAIDSLHICMECEKKKLLKEYREYISWKIENKQYISEEEFQRKKNPAAAELKKSKVTGKSAGKKNKKGKKK